MSAQLPRQSKLPRGLTSALTDGVLSISFFRRGADSTGQILISPTTSMKNSERKLLLRVCARFRGWSTCHSRSRFTPALGNAVFYRGSPATGARFSFLLSSRDRSVPEGKERSETNGKNEEFPCLNPTRSKSATDGLQTVPRTQTFYLSVSGLMPSVSESRIPMMLTNSKSESNRGNRSCTASIKRWGILDGTLFKGVILANEKV